MRKHLFSVGSFLKLFILSLISISQPSYAQKYSQQDIDRICGTKMEISRAGSVSAYTALDKQVQEQNAKVDACIQNLLINEVKQAEIDAVPVGGRFPNASVNGVPLRKCSHGGVCHSDLIQQMQTGSY